MHGRNKRELYSSRHHSRNAAPWREGDHKTGREACQDGGGATAKHDIGKYTRPTHAQSMRTTKQTVKGATSACQGRHKRPHNGGHSKRLAMRRLWWLHQPVTLHRVWPHRATTVWSHEVR